MGISQYSVGVFVIVCVLANAIEAADEGVRTFDFIVVGAGATGSIVAARLATETSKTVLLIEGGRKGTGQKAVGGTDFVASVFDTDPRTGLQYLDPVPLTRYDVPIYYNTIRPAGNVLRNAWGINSVGPFYSQSKVIGGNGASNGMAWLIPTDISFDLWNISGYSGADMRYYFKKMENATQSGFLGSPLRGYSGPINVWAPTFYDPVQYNFLNACLAAGFPIGGDNSNGTDSNGVTYTQANNLNGIRDSSSVAFLAPAFATQRNLELWSGSTVTRVLFDEHKNTTGVEFVDEWGRLKTVNARLEVILTAGTLQTPKILYNSGIGPASILDAFGKPHVVVNPVIGQKIRNQQRFVLNYLDPKKVNPTFYATPTVTVDYASNGAAVPGSIMAVNGGYGVDFKVNPSHPNNDVSVSAGAIAGGDPNNLYSQVFTIAVTLLYQVYANGTLNLTSPDPLANTTFTANTFVVQEDLETLALGIIEARKIMAHYPDPLTETFPGPQYNTTALLIPIIQSSGGTACHYAGSVPIGNSPSSPLDPRMRVRGVTRLRVVGPPINPGYVSSGMQATAYALGEKGTDLIKEDYGL